MTTGPTLRALGGAGRGGDRGPLNAQRVRQDFPILRQRIHGKALVYLDNAASAQKLQPVIDAEGHLYQEYYANIHRGVHALSVGSTEAYEAARATVQRSLNAAHREEIVCVRGTTEAIKLVAHCYGRPNLRPGDEGRWKTDTAGAGELPGVLDGEPALIAGRILVALDLASGKVLWTIT